MTRPDGTWLTQYFDEVGQALHRVLSDGDPAETDPPHPRWVTKVTRDSAGRVTEVSTPANVTGYTHDATTFSITTSTSAGLVWVYTYVGSGDMTGFLADRKFKKGTSPDPYFLETLTYSSASKTIDEDLAVVRPFVASRRKYPEAITSGTSGSTVDTYTYTMYSGSLVPEKMVTNLFAVTTGKNGSGSAVSESVHYTQAGLVDYAKSPKGIISYREYVSGQVTRVIEDADTAQLSNVPTGFSSSGTELHQESLYTYDAQGRRRTTTHPGGRVELTYHSRLADERLVTLSYPKYVTATPTFHGPVGYSVRNHAGRTEAQAAIALTGNSSTVALTSHVDETDSDPITAIDGLGELCRLSTMLYDEPGTRETESRLYFAIPGSSAGTEGTHYDATRLAHDDMGRPWRTKEPSGTIRRSVFDALGRQIESWVGTNDSGFAGGESSGTDDMVKVEKLEYDGGSDSGNSYLTARTLYVEDSTTDQRVWPGMSSDPSMGMKRDPLEVGS